MPFRIKDSGLTSSTRPKPPTPRVAMTSRWSKGLDDGNSDTMSFSRMMSGDSGWLWWRDTDFFLNGDRNLYFHSKRNEKQTQNIENSFHSLFWPELAALHPPGMSLLVVTIECCHVALEVLLQLVEGAHRLIKCPRKTTTTRQLCNHRNVG